LTAINQWLDLAEIGENMGLVIDNLPEAAKILENHGEAVRVKKMLYCLFRKSWENDPKVFDQYSVEMLITEIIRLYPTLKRLVFSLHGLIKSLNRQEVYAPLAKDILHSLAPIYDVDPSEVDDTEIHKLIAEKQKTEKKENHACLNLMELLVKEAVFQEVQKLPVNVAKFITIAEVSAYALNRLPSLYVSSEEGKYFQLKKAEGMKEMIRTAVMQGIGAVMRDPLRKSTPLNLCSIDSSSTAFNLLIELEEFIKNNSDYGHKIPMNELSDKLLETLKSYEVSLRDVENFLRLQNLSKDKVTPKNLASTVRKVIRNLLQKPGDRRAVPVKPSVTEPKDKISKQLDAQETMIGNFTESNQSEDEFATSIRDWYSF
ncbi:MAG: late competence development ComFB family protein, partial [Microcystaceae cyanobacterium]